MDDWGASMASVGVTSFDATQWHTWQWLYRKDDTYDVYMDGIRVQSGHMHWTDGATPNRTPIDMEFIFDGAWGNNRVGSVNHPMPASELAGTYYEWDYSRVYLR